jgi:hypothetical protein
MSTATLDSRMPVPFIDRARLMPIAEENAGAYQSAQPFPHIVIDGLLPMASIERLIREFPKPEDIEWRRYKNARENKLATSSVEDLGPFTRLLLAELNSLPFLTFLENLTGIDGLIPDPPASFQPLRRVYYHRKLIPRQPRACDLPARQEQAVDSALLLHERAGPGEWIGAAFDGVQGTSGGRAGDRARRDDPAARAPVDCSRPVGPTSSARSGARAQAARRDAEVVV